MHLAVGGHHRRLEAHDFAGGGHLAKDFEAQRLQRVDGRQRLALGRLFEEGTPLGILRRDQRGLEQTRGVAGHLTVDTKEFADRAGLVLDFGFKRAQRGLVIVERGGQGVRALLRGFQALRRLPQLLLLLIAFLKEGGLALAMQRLLALAGGARVLQQLLEAVRGALGVGGLRRRHLRHGSQREAKHRHPQCPGAAEALHGVTSGA